MNSTEKAEMQVDELDDGGAAVMLPEGEHNPQDQSAESAQDHDDDHDDVDDDIVDGDNTSENDIFKAP